MSVDVETGDIVRVRVLGTNDDWCICRVELVSHNRASLALAVVDGCLRVGGGLMMGAVAVVADYRGAYELFTGAELEVELKRRRRNGRSDA
jgi:hypothetical protein